MTLLVYWYVHAATHFRRLHVQHFSDPSLHDQEMRVINIQLDRAEQILNSGRCGIASIDQVFVTATNNNLQYQIHQWHQ